MGGVLEWCHEQVCACCGMHAGDVKVRDVLCVEEWGWEEMLGGHGVQE